MHPLKKSLFFLEFSNSFSSCFKKKNHYHVAILLFFLSLNVIRANTCLSSSSGGSCRLVRVCGLSEFQCLLPEATSSPWCHRYAKRLGGDRLLSIHTLRDPECYRDIRTSIFHHSLPLPTLFSFRFSSFHPFL